MKTKFLLTLFLCALFACVDEQNNTTMRTNDEDRINDLLLSVDPMFSDLRKNSSGKEDPVLISYEIVKDLETGMIAIVNFSAEEIFPILGSEELARMSSGGTYQVDCNKNGKVTSQSCDGAYSCGKIAKACLDDGGCATVCKKPLSAISSIKDDDIRFLQQRRIDPSLIEAFKELNYSPSFDLVEAVKKGKLSSTKMERVIY